MEILKLGVVRNLLKDLRASMMEKPTLSNGISVCGMRQSTVS